jgi:hypothetical protein
MRTKWREAIIRSGHRFTVCACGRAGCCRAGWHILWFSITIYVLAVIAAVFGFVMSFRD